MDIKYRIWNDSRKEYYAPTYRGYAGRIEELFIQPSGRMIMREVKGTQETMIDESAFEERFDVEMWTGLHDVNGKEIYENDLVDNGHTVIYSGGETQRFSDIGVINYDVKNGCLVINNRNGYNKRLTQKTIKQCDIKVIGNIHQENK